MSKSMKSLFPDVNVWLALNHEIHSHHLAAKTWFEEVDEQTILVFCRQTQMGLFRLLTTQSVMGEEALTLRQCWRIYSRWIEGGRAELWNEPHGFESAFRHESNTEEQSPKRWSDAYLSAFARTTDSTLVTFDRALAGKTKDPILLG